MVELIKDETTLKVEDGHVVVKREMVEKFTFKEHLMSLDRLDHAKEQHEAQAKEFEDKYKELAANGIKELCEAENEKENNN